MPYAVMNLHSRAVQIDHEGAYAIVDDGPRFTVTPLSMGDGPAIFPDLDEAEAWREKRLAEMKGEADG
jgi:hypothetical protein